MKILQFLIPGKSLRFINFPDGNDPDSFMDNKSKEDFFSETKGIISLSYFKSGQDEVSGIAVWESKETLEANAERVQSIMGGLIDYVTAPPEIVEGDLEYQFKGK